MKRVRILRDTSGASIVIALVFFLICGIVGSVVMTAASVQAKAAQTHVDLQQKEYAMQSAAKLMAQQLGGEDAVWEEKSVVVKIAYDTAGEASVDTNSLRSMIGQNFWTEQRTKDILAARAEGKDYVLGGSASNRLLIDPPSEAGGLAPVYGCITVDPDLNITVELSLDSAFAADSPYNTTISVQCTPTFDNQGRVTVIEYHREEDGGGVMIGKTTRVLREKLQDCHGDTMVEVLAAVFIAALGATMLATMVTVSATASARSQQVLNASYAAEASLYDSSSYGPVVSVTLPDSSTAVPIKVSVYQSGGYAYYEEGR